MILMGSKHGSNSDQDHEIPLSAPTYDKQDLEVKQLLNRSEQATNASRVSSAYETATEDNKRNRMIAMPTTSQIPIKMMKGMMS